jgi:hypothetical protein
MVISPSSFLGRSLPPLANLSTEPRGDDLDCQSGGRGGGGGQQGRMMGAEVQQVVRGMVVGGRPASKGEQR